MILKNSITKSVRLLAAIAAVGTASVSQAITTYKVSLDTSSLILNPAAPFYLDFLLTDGSGLGNGNNTITVSDFQFGGGNAVAGTETTFGEASGDLTSSVTLMDTGFWNELYQEFNPGSWLSFLVSFTNNVESAGTPDLFSFSILDSTLFPIMTEAYDFSDSLVQITLDGDSTLIESFAGAGDYSDIGAPLASPVPDSTYGIGLISMLALLVAKRRFGSQTAAHAA